MLFKTCSKCKTRKDINEFSPWKWAKDGRYPQCKPCKNEVDRKQWARVGSERRREKYHTDPEYRAKLRDNSNTVDKDKASESKKRRHRELREAVLVLYGYTCTCCGESRREFLSIEHINGGGTQHRKSMDCQKIYRQLLAEEKPLPDYTLLCHNCNQARGYYGYCPHERES
jgi:hypothetical protein